MVLSQHITWITIFIKGKINVIGRGLYDKVTEVAHVNPHQESHPQRVLL